jgi:hypothetical protein
MRRASHLALIAVIAGLAARDTLAQRYDPYAEGHEVLTPVAADGTIRWGTFYKSAELQSRYERLWNLGACRGTNKAITVPVANNKVLIDRLPEGEFAGVVQGVSGPLAGGVVAFMPVGAAAQDAALFAQLHPAGVTRLTVTGTIALESIRPGMVVRIRATVDERGRASQPLRALTVVTPPVGFVPDAVRPGHDDTLVGTVVSCRMKTLVVRIDAGSIRRLTCPLADDAVATVDGARFDLVAPGDAAEFKGRLWSGEGSAGAGTIFASYVTVTKRPAAAHAGSGAAAAAAGAEPPRTVE